MSQLLEMHVGPEPKQLVQAYTHSTLTDSAQRIVIGELLRLGRYMHEPKVHL